VKYIKIDGLEPTAENLANRKYPFYRLLSAVTDEHPSEAIKRLIHEAQTGKAFFKVARKYHLLPLNKPAKE
jgi:ABC-type phosphate transport system substrate-binding protein